jgi:triacylglycerol esterase/lipase EstA (alpha/beta hydrolase family)
MRMMRRSRLVVYWLDDANDVSSTTTWAISNHGGL